MSRTRCSCGASPVRRVGAWCCGSRTTTGSARGPSSTPRCSRTSAGWGSSPTSAPFASRSDWFVYETALARLRDRGLVYACDCTRSTFAAWARRAWAAVVGQRLSGRLPRPRRCGGPRNGPARRARTRRRSRGTTCDLDRDATLPTANGDLLVRDRQRQLDVPVLRRRRRPAPGHRSRRPRRGPARCDGAPDPARPAPGTRPPARVLPPPADPQARGREAVEVGRRYRRP